MSETVDAQNELNALTSLFFPSPAPLGRFEPVAADQLPPRERTLLDHDEHMTVAMDCHYEQPIDLLVLDTASSGVFYARRSWLTRRSDGKVVQYCVVRLNMTFVDEPMRRDIENQQIPLGRICIHYDRLRRVRPLAMWRIHPGPELERAFRLEKLAPCYGRLAIIEHEGVRAGELLEIAAPE